MGTRASRLADPVEVSAQYRDPSRLDDRTDLYARFGSEQESWYRWLYTRIAPAAADSVLDAGCGAGGVWGANSERLPASLRLALVDRSPGMARAARERLAGVGTALVGDLRSLPFRDASFDVVTANHVLYHLPDPGGALRELARTVRPGGRICVATNDWTHLQELRELIARFHLGGIGLSPGRDADVFDLERAADEISARLGPVRVERRRELLRVTEVGPLLSYVRSLVADGAPEESRVAELGRHVERQIELAGAFEIVACGGVVVAERSA